MKHLQKISIANARSFVDFQIDIGPGATIILGPNGIGKTTIFEAIEFAITGNIQRLKKDLFPFIRNKQSDVIVRLEFEEGKYCEIKCYRDEINPIIKGDHKILLKNQELNTVPYLFRLTHFLEQRTGQWFVQTSGENAGNYLDKLPIWKDLNSFNSKMTKAKNRATDLQKNAEMELTIIQKKLDEFNELIEKRKSVSINFKLKPLNIILIELKELFKVANGSIEEVNENLGAILGFSGQIRVKIENQIKEIKSRSVSFAGLENLVSEYDSNNKILKLKMESNEKLSKEKIDLENKTHNQKIQLQKISEQIDKMNLEIKDLNEKKKIFEVISIEKSRKSEKVNELEENKKLLLELQEELKQKTEELEKFYSIQDTHAKFRKQAEEQSKFKGRISTLTDLLNNWKTQDDIIHELENTVIVNLKNEKKTIEISLNKVRNRYENYEQLYKKALNEFTAIQDATDSIHNAVSIIASNLSKDRGDCPVCGHVYNPAELKNRISKALEAVDPMMLKALENKKEATEKYEESKSEFNKIQLKLDQINEKLDNTTNQCIELRSIINEQIRPQFPQCDNFQDGKKWFLKLQETLKINQQKLDESIKNAPDEPNPEQVSSLETEKVNIERINFDINNHIKTVHIDLNEIVEKFEILQKKIVNLDLEFIKKEIESKEKILDQQYNNYEELNLQQRKLQESFNETINLIDNNKIYISKVFSRQSEIKMVWTNAKLKDEPDLRLLLQEKELINKKLDSLEKAKITLDKITEDLARWQTAELYQNYDNEIKKICVTKNEEDYLSELKINEENCKSKLQIIKDKSDILKSLHLSIKTQLEFIYESINLVNPFWRKLLSRVIINTWFMETSLFSYSSYNKPKAETIVPLNEKNVPVSDVASEAQITDLQLTFMLAMAKTYTWTPWQALLLDDPTQHHDLVHASSVFDLLRDYISDYDFQVLFATHDSVHARFFLRKLQNEGLPARLWTLFPSDTGVKAKKFE